MSSSAPRDHRPYYEANKSQYRRRAQEYRDRMYDQLAELKAGPCTDCGQTFPACAMQFDHVGDDKVDNVSSMINRHPWSEVEAEIAKCELVCANCHAIRTYTRNHARRAAVPNAPVKPAPGCRTCGTTEDLVPRRRFCRADYNAILKQRMRERRATSSTTKQP